MNRFLLVIFGALALGGCGSPENKAIDLTNEMADVLSTIKDKEAARAAFEQLEEMYEETRSLKGEIEMEEASREKMEELIEAGKRVQKEWQRIMDDPELREVLQDLKLR